MRTGDPDERVDYGEIGKAVREVFEAMAGRVELNSQLKELLHLICYELGDGEAFTRAYDRYMSGQNADKLKPQKERTGWWK